MMTSRRLFGTNGIRGVANEELTPNMAIQIGCAVGTFFQQKEVLIGHDARTSGPMLEKAVISGLNATGCGVLLGGMAPTPALQFAVKAHKLNGAVIVTASHNPPEYNGIKVVWKDGIELSREQETKIEKVFFDEKTRYAEWNGIGGVREMPGIVDDYLEGVRRHVDATKIEKHHYHVVVDAANSVGNLSVPRLLRDLGCKVTTINGNIDGTFPGRLPEPRPENLNDLASMVEAVNADLGVALDGDADRSVFAGESGEIYWGDKTFALVEKHFLMDNPGEKIVTPVSSSTLIKDIAESHSGELVWTKVGSVTVSQTMKKLNAKLGGEENGGVFYGPHQAVRDGAMATALILAIMAKRGENLSKLIRELPRYYIEKGKIECPEELKQKVLGKLTEQVRGKNMSTIDGIKLWFDDKSAILVRPSGTEPVYRLYAEAKTEKKASQLVKEYVLKLKKIISALQR